MPIEIIDALRAAVLGRAPQADWPGKKDPGRLHPVARPHSRPPFRIGREDKVFCIGSCFAREIERALHAFDFEVLTYPTGLPPLADGRRSDTVLLNRYNVPCMLRELRHALEPDAAPLSFFERPGGLAFDLLSAGGHHVDGKVRFTVLRQALDALFRRVAAADVVVMTLGLAEAWHDGVENAYLNQPPPRDLIRREPRRFSLHVLDHAENLAALEAIRALLLKHLPPGFRMLVTVSPVPLSRTYRDADVLVANSYSKAVLRAAAEQFCHGKPDVGYFPSYETVLLSDPALAWQSKDWRHVTPAMVRYITAAALSDYAEEGFDLGISLETLRAAAALPDADFLSAALAED